jgi:hypothetical protein
MEKALGRGCEVLLAEFGAGISRIWRESGRFTEEVEIITGATLYDWTGARCIIALTDS